MSDCNFCKEIDFHEIIESIVSALDAKDPYTAGHSEESVIWQLLFVKYLT